MPSRFAGPGVDPGVVAVMAGSVAEADWIGLWFVQDHTRQLRVRNGRIESLSLTTDLGLMAEVMVDGFIAHAATSDLSFAGIEAAVRAAVGLARLVAPYRLFAASRAHRQPARGQFIGSDLAELDSASLGELVDRLVASCARLAVSERVVTTRAELSITDRRQWYFSSTGSEVEQSFRYLTQNFAATARDGGEVQQRSWNGPTARCWQGDLASIDWEEVGNECERVGGQALELLRAENCPDERLDLILAPDQMLLQIHESIGHPLELDRILGDERNYAGWSFVRPEDFGCLQYGSALLNVRFEPQAGAGFASYGFDDVGAPATTQYLIRDGVLLRGLGGIDSQLRSGLPGVAACRAASWNRPPIDRMGNINVEPGSSSLEAMIGSVERGLIMFANRSWSIDDYRDKFQFGCEFAQLIEDGRLTRVVKNPNYRGRTLPFWRSLRAVGDTAEVQAFGTPFCGKGEPNQAIRVGHAAPPCLFAGVEVFGGGC